jgi:ubiquinone/menaquinone biosynthesis C-methylase UbiE
VTNWWKTAFDSDLYRAVAPMERNREVLDAERRLLPQWLNLQPGQTVLDLACGDGRLAVPMAAAGYKVVGLDLSPKMLGSARRRMPEAQGRLELIQGDMRDFKLQHQVDAAYCVFVSFGLFLDEADHAQTLKAIAAAVKPGGRLYLEAYNPYCFLSPSSLTERIEGGMVIYQTLLDHWTSRINSQIHFARMGRPTQTVGLSWRAFTLFELVKLLEAAGFSIVQANGGVSQPDDFVPIKAKVLGIVAEKQG